MLGVYLGIQIDQARHLTLGRLQRVRPAGLQLQLEVTQDEGQPTWGLLHGPKPGSRGDGLKLETRFEPERVLRVS